MVLYGPLWSSIWSPMVLYGPLWSPMVLYVPLCSPMVPYGPLWSHIVLYGPLWSYMVPYGPYGPLWSLMVTYGALCIFPLLFHFLIKYFGNKSIWLLRFLHFGLSRVFFNTASLDHFEKQDVGHPELHLCLNKMSLQHLQLVAGQGATYAQKSTFFVITHDKAARRKIKMIIIFIAR